MIKIGVTGWGDHDTLYKPGTKSTDKLKEYGAHFPIVELDASFYAVQPERNNRKWLRDTPDTFQFIVKAYQGMTGHQRGDIPFNTKEEMFDAFKLMIGPYEETGKLACVLFQFPPWFDCRKEHVDYLRWCKRQMNQTPCALEFRHESWYLPGRRESTLEFIRKEGWIHTICDEPQAGEKSIPIVLEAGAGDRVFVRFHGRNVHGWNKVGNDQHWREVRYLYRYNEAELKDWANKLKELERQCGNVYAVFNNNSGGDAADNAKQMIDLLGLEYDDLAPKQLDLF
ncbi:DUF72 domain-containing protein [Aciduricibacillus chroicocephali]|uniref:DUF72 domain-containing protein n=1 Tax=Aciduricibacillus chroicocephali TaxID=3054939 RepID=A0ABY9KWI4_9BACI|nr:DUF72 domain-containing protein [Bacillaceae bacterium 44XB]